MPETESSKPKELGIGWLLLISFVLVTGSFVIDQTIRWSSPWDGFLNGLVHIAYFGSGMLLDVIPWSLLIWGVCRWVGLRRFRPHLILAPAAIQSFVLLSQLVSFPPTARGSFKQFTKAEIPEDARKTQYHLWGGGMADYSISYYFECSQESVAKLITSMQMGEGFEITPQYAPHMPHIGRLTSPPDLARWTGGKSYSREDGGWTFYLVTDPTKTKVYIWMCCI